MFFSLANERPKSQLMYGMTTGPWIGQHYVSELLYRLCASFLQILIISVQVFAVITQTMICFWIKLVQCQSVGCCARVNNLLFQTSQSSLLIGCVLSWQVVETGKLPSNICLPVWQASPLKGRKLFRPSAGALRGVGWWSRDTCSSLQLAPRTHSFPLQCDQSGNEDTEVLL